MSTFERFRDRFEAYLCVIVSGACMVIAICVGVGMVIVVNQRSSPAETGIWVGIAVALSIIEFIAVNFVVKGYHSGLSPLAPVLAMRQPRWPFWFAPLIAIYWMIHWLAFLGLMLLCESVVAGIDLSGRPLIAAYTVLILAAFGVSYSANVYLLLMVAAIRRSENLIDRIWRWRIIIDLALVGLAFVLI